MGFLRRIFKDAAPRKAGPDPLADYLNKMSKKGELHLAPGFKPVGMRQGPYGWEYHGGMGPDGKPIPHFEYVGDDEMFTRPWGKRAREERRAEIAAALQGSRQGYGMEPREMGMQQQYPSQGHGPMYGGGEQMPPPPQHVPRGSSLHAQHGSQAQGRHSLQGGMPLPSPPHVPRGSSMQVQHGSQQYLHRQEPPHIPRGSSMHAQHGSQQYRPPNNPLSPHQPQPQPQAHSRGSSMQAQHGSLPRAQIPPGVIDPLATQGAPKSKGHYGMRLHVPGMTGIDVQRHGRADDPDANYGVMSEIGRAGGNGDGNVYGGDARGGVRNPRVSGSGRRG
ncbi:hypothetical protein BKA63DRAFT_596208 [Paraphoma chrysanthemicola]|nr:hypothetical protein BKA63DRAFT_596208 [Paraphoma chrysanthemicola]